MALFNRDNSPESQQARQELRDLKAQMRQERRDEKQAQKAAQLAAQQQARAAIASILVTTGDLNARYEIIDCIFAIDSSREGFISGVNPDVAFDGVKNVLRARCYQLGGQAVINCQFQYRNASDGRRQVLEIFAYGTAVRLQ